MKSNSILFVGCGDLGCRSGAILLERGWQVSGLRRDPSKLPAGFVGFAGDYTEAGSLDFIAQLRPDYVVATFNPSDRSVAGYHRGFAGGTRNLLAGLGSHRPRGILAASSTRVYAERDGGWVDEHSALDADDPRALAMIAAERALLDSTHATGVIRFAGIYGYPGGRLLERIRRGELSPERPLRYSNRIHRDDCAGFLCHLLERNVTGEKLAPVYNAVDDMPAAQFDVETWLAAAMGVTKPGTAAQRFSGAGSDNPLKFGHKRCTNRLLHASAYKLVYPDYRSGYGAVLAAVAG
ncbi:MAG: epimerase [Pseudomonadales bacterium]|nr:epimerase [Halioglobus sp.]MCP5128301.1 epimerase [Pseudomonadales bacterium]